MIIDRGLPNKKASLNLSINAIVIVVLAMTLLGLGLTLVRNVFKGIEEQREEVTEQIRSQILEDLRTGNKKLSFPSTQINLEKRESKVIAMGVKNTKTNSVLDFVIGVEILEARIPGVTDPGELNDIDFFYDTTAKSLKVTDADVYSIRMTSTGRSGVYMTKLSVLEGNSTYAEKTFFINVI
ncbi:MAG: hypothetical protein V3V78_00060 [Candidatus Woesearchaeota archaeon]